ncbi:MAG: ATP-binding protein [Verrucomicrobiota bacterium]
MTSLSVSIHAKTIHSEDGHQRERFFRGDASHNREVEGCGLGLSIAQWIVHAHGGTIQFASQPGQLTTVTVRLPLAGAG